MKQLLPNKRNIQIQFSPARLSVIGGQSLLNSCHPFIDLPSHSSTRTCTLQKAPFGDSLIPIKWVESHQFQISLGFVAIFQVGRLLRPRLKLLCQWVEVGKWHIDGSLISLDVIVANGRISTKKIGKMAKNKFPIFISNPSTKLVGFQDSMGTRRKPFGSPGWLGTAIRSKRRGISWKHGQCQVDPHGRLKSRLLDSLILSRFMDSVTQKSGFRGKGRFYGLCSIKQASSQPFWALFAGESLAYEACKINYTSKSNL